MLANSYHTYIKKEGNVYIAEFPHLTTRAEGLSTEDILYIICTLKSWLKETKTHLGDACFKLKMGEELIPIGMQ